MTLKHLMIYFVISLFLSAVVRSGNVDPQENADPVEAVRRQVEMFPVKEPLRVTFHDGSEKSGCLYGSDQDGFVIGRTPIGAQKILYMDVSSVKSVKAGKAKRIFRGILNAGILAGTVFSVAKIGSNTPKTVVAKVWLGSPVVYVAAHATLAVCR